MDIRAFNNFESTDNQTLARTLANYNPATLYPQGTIFSVIITPLAPWVTIQGLDTDVDPGNLNHSRSVANSQISGLLIDYLETMASRMDVQMEYFFPCKKTDVLNKGECGTLDASDSLQVLSGNQSYYIPPCSSSGQKCFATNIQDSIYK